MELESVALLSKTPDDHYWVFFPSFFVEHKWLTYSNVSDRLCIFGEKENNSVSDLFMTSEETIQSHEGMVSRKLCNFRRLVSDVSNGGWVDERRT